MKAVISHWRLAYRTFIKAVKITLKTVIRQFKLGIELERFDSKLRKRRKFINKQYDKINL